MWCGGGGWRRERELIEKAGGARYTKQASAEGRVSEGGKYDAGGRGPRDGKMCWGIIREMRSRNDCSAALLFRGVLCIRTSSDLSGEFKLNFHRRTTAAFVSRHSSGSNFSSQKVSQ